LTNDSSHRSARVQSSAASFGRASFRRHAARFAKYVARARSTTPRRDVVVFPSSFERTTLDATRVSPSVVPAPVARSSSRASSRRALASPVSSGSSDAPSSEVEALASNAAV
jgi:hypothetical protein